MTAKKTVTERNAAAAGKGVANDVVERRAAVSKWVDSPERAWDWANNRPGSKNIREFSTRESRHLTAPVSERKHIFNLQSEIRRLSLAISGLIPAHS